MIIRNILIVLIIWCLIGILYADGTYKEPMLEEAKVLGLVLIANEIRVIKDAKNM